MVTSLSEIIKVLIIDDSAVMRELLKSILTEDSRFEVVGVSSDPILAKKKIPRVKPDVLTLDVEMPNMDGLTFLKELMEMRPMPVVMVSSHTAKGAKETFRALELGAVDFITKPKMDNSGSLDPFISELRTKVHAASKAKIRSNIPPRQQGFTIGQRTYDRPKPTSIPKYSALKSTAANSRKVIVLGASTGGTQAIQALAEVLPADTPGIAVVQHMPPRFTEMYAQRIDNLSSLDIREARDGDPLTTGTMLIANGAYHMALHRSPGKNFTVKVFDGELRNQHKPSVDVLFESAAQHGDKDILGIILTGMGKDGSQGMLAMHNQGSYTIAQDEKSCVIYGMPDQANKLGAVSIILSLNDIPRYIERWAAGDLIQRRVAS